MFTFPTARPPTTEQITPHTFTTSVCGGKQHAQGMTALPVHQHSAFKAHMCLYLESHHPGNLDSIQVTFYLRNTTSCRDGLDETNEEWVEETET